MKKIYQTSIFIFSLTIQGFSQTVNDVPLNEIDAEYIEITVGIEKAFSTQVTIDINFGQKFKFFPSDKHTALRDKNGKRMEFNSMIDALNFMYDYGYEFVQVYTVGDTVSRHFIMNKINDPNSYAGQIKK